MCDPGKSHHVSAGEALNHSREGAQQLPTVKKNPFLLQHRGSTLPSWALLQPSLGTLLVSSTKTLSHISRSASLEQEVKLENSKDLVA